MPRYLLKQSRISRLVHRSSAADSVHRGTGTRTVSICRSFVRLLFDMALPYLAALAIVLLPAFAAGAPRNGEQIINNAALAVSGVVTSTSSTTVTYRQPTPATIEFLQYAPRLPQPEDIPLVSGAYRPGADPALSLQPLPPPQMVGAPAALDLTVPVPLTAAHQYHQNDPLFVRVSDLDMNMDDAVRETVLVTISVPATGDTEVIRLTETGPASGVFAGYITSAAGPGTPYDGAVQVAQGSGITATFVDPYDGSDTTAAAVLVDPFGRLFDSSTGVPLDGVAITLCDASLETAVVSPLTPCTSEAHVKGDDGFSSFPATIISGSNARDASGKFYSFPTGGYRFPFVDPGQYRYAVTLPPGYTGPSTVTTPSLQALPGAPVIVSGSRGERFLLNPGPALRIDIPLDPASGSGLWVSKSAGRDLVAPGEFITFDLSVTNTSATVPVDAVQLVDAMPPGFRLRNGSVTVAGLASSDPSISADGKTLVFPVGSLAPAAVYSLRFVAEVSAGAPIGTVTNLGYASAAGGRLSNIATAVVKVRDDLLRTRSILMGRVTTGSCPTQGDEPQAGLEGVRLYLEDGSFVVSDKQGLYHFEGIRPGLHVVQMDLDSLPEGSAALPCTENSRFAGRAFSQFVELQGGTLWRADFHVRTAAAPPQPQPHADVKQEVKPPKIDTPPAAAVPLPEGKPVSGTVALELSNRLEAGDIAYRIQMRGSSQPDQSLRVTVMLPEGVQYVPGSSRRDGAPLPDPIQYGTIVLAYTFNAGAGTWQHDLTFSARPSADTRSGTLSTLAYLAANSPGAAPVLTPPVETLLLRDNAAQVVRLPAIVLRPHFPTFGAELDAEDRERLDELARLLTALHADHIHVTGHTDSVRIAPRSRTVYRDNQALSLARARSVGRYLMDKLHLPPEKLTLEGRGASVPLADNRTASGRELNRRVEVQTSSSRSFNSSHLRVLKELSGQQVVSTVNPAAAGSPLPTMATAPPVVVKSVPAQLKAEIVAAPPAAATAPAAAVSPLPEAAVRGRGLIRPHEGDTLLEKINAVQLRLATGLVPHLLVDGIEIPHDRIGYKATEPDTGTTFYSYLGVDLGTPGTHKLEVKGLDPFGNTRFSATATVIRTGEIARIQLKEAGENVADGITPVRLRVELFDADGHQLKGAARLQIKDGTLKPYSKPQDRDKQTLDDLSAGRMAEVDNDGWILFQPVTSSGSFNAVLGYNSASCDVDVYVKPKLRDWILVGLAEGTAGYNAVSGNMESLKAGEAQEQFYQDGRIAFFAKGQIKGAWLLTMSYDSAKSRDEAGASLFQQIDPDSYYTLYGDSTLQQYDAASSKKLYLKIEREQFYAMFGDFDSGLSVTELSRYSRRMTGIKTEFQGRYVEAGGFAAESTQLYQRDEIPGDGTSGLYRLRQRPLVINSETITIITRDRFHSERIISARALSRFTDYAIDYQAGTIFFKQPVTSKDENFNPITIVAEYEALSGVESDYTYGGRVGVKLLDKRLRIGATHIHEGLGDSFNNLLGVDTTLLITDTTRLRGELAGTESDRTGTTTRGYSYLAELTHSSKRFDGKAYIREQQGAFGLGQQMGSESATRKIGLEGNYRLNESFSSSASLYRQTNLALSTERDVAEGKVSYTTKKYSTSLGLLNARDRLTDGSSMSSGQVTAGGKLLTLGDRLTLSIDHAQSIWGNSNVDFPTRTTFGAEYRMSEKITLLGAQEFTWGTAVQTNATRLGVRTTPWKGGTLTSTIERQLNENGQRVFGNMGLRQSWQLSDEWKVDAGLDRSQTLVKKLSYSLNPAVPAASGGSEDFSAVSTGATYLIKGLTWDSRFEYRTSASEDKWGALSGIVKEQGGGWAWSARGQYFQTDVVSGLESRRANIRLGMVYRPAQTRWIHLDRLDLIHDGQSGGGQAAMVSWRAVNNYTANYHPAKQLQISLKYGAKFVVDSIDSHQYRAFIDHCGSELRYDLTTTWDIGLRGSLLHSWQAGQLAGSGGAALGYNIVENAWISLGYNFWGFSDKDFSTADYTAQGPYLRFRIKFDQQTVKEAAGWLNKE